MRAPQLDQRHGRGLLLAAITVGLTVVIAAPIALSSRDLVQWASSPEGLGLPSDWAWFVFLALDLAAAVCVGMVVYAAWRGESGGVFGILVWAFAGASAYANYRHGMTTPARDDQWFYPAMSLAGPALLEATVRRVRRWVQTSAGRYESPLPHFRITRWLVAPRETGTAWRLAVTEGHSRPEEAVAAARDVRRRKARHAVEGGELDEGQPVEERPVTPQPLAPNPDARPARDVPLPSDPGPEVEGDPGDEDEAADRWADRVVEAIGQRSTRVGRAELALAAEVAEAQEVRPVPRDGGTHRHQYDPAKVAELTAGGAMSVRNARRRLPCIAPACPDREEDRRELA